MIRKKILVQGAVQGVGFRPFIYNLAAQLGLTGFIANTTTGVTIEAQGPVEAVEKFSAAIADDHPPLALPEITHWETLALIETDSSFEIRSSQTVSQRRASITPDAATCPDCLAELADPADRRYRYPFINCTNCGPRYTIVFDLPYDRKNTTMHPFTMCSLCQAEYDDPTHRRFHAQPNACSVCGPKVWLTDQTGQTIPTDDPIKQTVALLEAGKIVAIKGLGGFHLAVRADRDESVQQLRQRKYRKAMAFALMVRDLQAAQQFADINPTAQKLLTDIARPIVLCPKKVGWALPTNSTEKPPSQISPHVAPNSRFWGVMLPYTPLHTMIMQGNYPALVMTSGNTTDEPIENENESALNRLSGIADAFLLHNRDIYTRCDDSVLKVFRNEPFMIRRARGYIPRPVPVARRTDFDILAVGAELKNTVTYFKADQAYTSQHLGSLTDASTYQSFQQTIKKLGALIEARPAVIACDLHPAMLSTRFAEQVPDVQLIRVQHHHAHIASVMGEYNLDEPVIGLSTDGLGYGSDGTIWGGELMLVWRDRFERRGFLEQVPMPGGDAASKQPWRMALSYLCHAFGPESGAQLAADLMPGIESHQIIAVAEMINKKINAPLTSSCGRLFDAVSALNQICYRNTYDAQAAIELENLAQTESSDPYPVELTVNNDTTTLAVAPIIRAIVADIQNGVPTPQIAARFHHTIAAAFAAMIQKLAQHTNINTIALAGGAFQNEILLHQLVTLLNNLHLKVYFNRKLPINDGSISFGQALVADAILSHKNKP